MSTSGQFLQSGTPVGAIISGQFANDPKFLPCDGNDYVSASYPYLNKTNLSTWGSNSWVSRTLPTTQRWYSVAFGAGVFVVVGANSGSTGGTVSATSPDGINWTNRTITNGVYTGVIFAGGQFVAFGSGVIATSPDGITWTDRTTPLSLNWSSIAYGNGLYVAVAYNTNTPGVCITSPDGITWTSRTITSSDMIGQSVIFAEGKFLMLPSQLAGAAVNRIFTSIDGVNWSYLNITVPFGSTSNVGTISWGRITYFKGLLILSGISERIFVSRDMGISWTTIPTNFSQNNAGIVSANGVLFMNGAPTQTGFLSHLWYSFDAFKWNRIEIPTSAGNVNWMNSTNTGAQLAFGANTYLAIVDPSSLGSNNICATLSIDTTKFRTPAPSMLTSDPLSAERTYIKVA